MEFAKRMIHIVNTRLSVSPHQRKILAGKTAKIIKVLLRTLFLIGMSYVLLYPVLFLLSNAFRSSVDTADPSVVWIPKHLTLRGITLAATTMKYGETILNTLKVAVPSILFQLATCMMVGYGFARFKFKEKSLLSGLLLFTIIVPVQTIVIPLYVNFRYFDIFGLGQLLGLVAGKPVTMNLLNTPWTFYLPSLLGMGIRSGLYIYIFRQFFRGMPKELEEAATIDGCGPFATFVRVMVPNAKTILLTVLLFTVVWHWNDYYLSFMFYDRNQPISLSLVSIMSRLDPQRITSGEDAAMMRYSVLEAGSLLVIAPIIVIYAFTQKYFTESIERTGIVG